MQHQTQMLKTIGQIIERITNENIIGLKITNAKTQNEGMLQTYTYHLQSPKQPNFTLVYKITIPKNPLNTDIKRIGFIINDLLKYFIQNLKEYTLTEIIKNTPTQWALAYEIHLTSTLEPQNIIKHTIIQANPSHYFTISEDLKKSNFKITIIKKHKNALISKKEEEQTRKALNILKEIATYDTNYKYRTLIYQIRLIPLNLLKYTTHPIFQLNRLTINIQDKTITITGETGLKIKQIKLPINILKQQAWPEKLIKTIHTENKPHTNTTKTRW